MDSNGKEAVRRREPGQRGGLGTSSVASLVRVLDENRLKPKAKEQEVLDVATEYFLQHGYRGASINAMARSSGISKESIYRYFSSKQQLFEAVIGRELIEYRRSLRGLDVTLRSSDLRVALIEAFGRRTGVPMLLNTSFNVRGEPIVCTPDDAVRCFVGTQMDLLVLGDLVCRKP